MKKKPLRQEDLAEFVRLYNPDNRFERVATWGEDNLEGRWRSFTREELLARDKASLDLFWLKDKSLTDLDNLPEPDDLAEEIIEGLEAGVGELAVGVGGIAGVRLGWGRRHHRWWLHGSRIRKKREWVYPSYCRYAREVLYY